MNDGRIARALYQVLEYVLRALDKLQVSSVRVDQPFRHSGYISAVGQLSLLHDSKSWDVQEVGWKALWLPSSQNLLVCWLSYQQ